MHITGNEIPGDKVELDLKVRPGSIVKTNSSNSSKKNSPSTATVVTFFVFGFLCFGAGAGSVRNDPKEASTPVVTATQTVPQPAQTVTRMIEIRTVPQDCRDVFDVLMRMQDPLNAVIDSSGTQVTIANRAYVAIVNKDAKALQVQLGKQYDLKRDTSTATHELQEFTAALVPKIESCNLDLK